MTFNTKKPAKSAYGTERNTKPWQKSTVHKSNNKSNSFNKSKSGNGNSRYDTWDNKSKSDKSKSSSVNNDDLKRLRGHGHGSSSGPKKLPSGDEIAELQNYTSGVWYEMRDDILGEYSTSGGKEKLLNLKSSNNAEDSETPVKRSKKEIKAYNKMNKDSENHKSNSSNKLGPGPRITISDLRKNKMIQNHFTEQKCREFFTQKSEIFEAVINADEEQRWLSKVAISGTMSDKIASLSTKIRMATVFSLPHIRSLVLMAQKKNRQESETAIDALKKIFISDDVLPDRKLKEFDENLIELMEKMPAFFKSEDDSSNGESDTVTSGKMISKDSNSKSNQTFELQIRQLQLVLYVEDSLRVLYAAFVNAVIQGAQDNIQAHKTKCIEILGELYCGKPELETEILENIVNKFGDTDRRIGSSIVGRIGRDLITKQPGCKLLIAKEVQRFVQGKIAILNTQAKYNAVVFLSELTFVQHYDMQLALQLVCFYSNILRHVFCKHRDSNVDNINGSKGRSAKGSSIKGKGKSESKKGNGKKGSTSSSKGKGKGKNDNSNSSENVAVGSESDLTHATCPEMENRLVRAVINGIKRALPYLSPEIDMEMFSAMSENFFEICHTTPSYATRISMLALLHKILVKKGCQNTNNTVTSNSSNSESKFNVVLSEGLSDRYFRLFYDQAFHFSLYSTSNRRELLSLLKEVVLSDSNTARSVAFLRRVSQVTFHIDSVVSAAATLLTGALLSFRRDAEYSLTEQPQESDNNTDNSESKSNSTVTVRSSIYDPLAREPRYAAADKSLFWEMHVSYHHVDPTVRVLGKSLGQPVGNVSHLNNLDTSMLSENNFLDLCALEKGQNVTFSESDANLNVSTNSQILNTNSKNKSNINNLNVVPHEEFLTLYYNQDLIVAKKLLRSQERAKRDAIKQTAADMIDLEEQEEEEELNKDSGPRFVTNDHKKEAEEDAFFDQYIESQMPADEDGEDDPFSDFSDFDKDSKDDESDNELKEGKFDENSKEEEEEEPVGELDSESEREDGMSDIMDEENLDGLSESEDHDVSELDNSDSNDKSESEKNGKSSLKSKTAKAKQLTKNSKSKATRPSKESEESDSDVEDISTTEVPESKQKTKGKTHKDKVDKSLKSKVKRAKLLVEKNKGSVFASADDFEEFMDV